MTRLDGQTQRSVNYHEGPTGRALHYVYRCYDKDGDLIYIGCTSNVKRRIAAHRQGHKAASRWLAVCMTRYEVEGPFYGRDAGLAAEAAAIALEQPVFNRQSRQVGTFDAKNEVGRYLVERGHVDLARATACTCWREIREVGARDEFCAAHQDEGRPRFCDLSPEEQEAVYAA